MGFTRQCHQGHAIRTCMAQFDDAGNATLTVGLTEDMKNKYADFNVWLIHK
jgi:hypothetical protein